MSSKTDIASQLAQLRAEDGARMEIYHDLYRPYGGWDSDALKAAYLASLAGEEIDQIAASVSSKKPERGADRAKIDGDGLIPERYDESGLGDAFVEAHPELIWNMTKRQWMRYDSDRGIWRFYDEQETNSIIDRFLQKVQKDGEEAFGKDDFAAGKRLGDQRTQDAVAKKIKAKHHIKQHQLDADPYRRVFANGVFDPRFPEKGMVPFDPALYSTRRVPLDYDPEATHDRLKDLLHPLPEDARDWFQLMAGQSMIGLQPAGEFAIFMYGPTAGNGKSVLFDIMEASLGKYVEDHEVHTGYFGRPDQSTLLAGDNYDLVGYQGLSQAGLEEMADKHIHASPFKRLVGTDSFKGRQIYGRPETVSNNSTIWITLNGLPSFDSSDQGVVRRIAVLPFEKKYVATERELADYPAGTAFPMDASLKTMAKSDKALHEAFLAYRMKGAIRWCATPDVDKARLERTFPASVQRATDRWIKREDTITGWIEDSIIFDPLKDKDGELLPPQHYCLTTDLFDSYSAWMKANGHSFGVKLSTFLDRFGQNRLVQLRSLESVRGRVGKLKRTPFDMADGSHKPAGTTPNHVKGIRFRTALEAHDIAPVDSNLTADEAKKLALLDLLKQAEQMGISATDLAQALENSPRVLVPADAPSDDLEDMSEDN